MLYAFLSNRNEDSWSLQVKLYVSFGLSYVFFFVVSFRVFLVTSLVINIVYTNVLRMYILFVKYFEKK